jgi:hypothetical protein
MTEDSRSIVDADGVEFRRVDRDEITDAMAEEMVALFRATFGRWPLHDPGVPALDHLRWKTSGPFTRIGSMQARVDGRIAFATTSWASWMRVGGRRCLRFVTTDTAMHPTYQGRRIYSRSVDYRRRLVTEPHDLSIHERGASTRNDRPLGRKGQTPVANKVTRQHRILRPLAFAGTRGRLELAPFVLGLAAFGAARAATRRGALRRGALRTQEENRFDARFDDLFEEAAKDFDFINERSADLLRWRYGDRRAGPFVVRSVTDRDRLLGYAVLRPAGAKAYLADLLAAPGRVDVLEALLADAVESAHRGGASGLECWLSGRHPYRAALRRQGFFDSRTDVGVEFHPIAATAEDLRCLRDPRARLHLQLGDTDMV